MIMVFVKVYWKQLFIVLMFVVLVVGGVVVWNIYGDRQYDVGYVQVKVDCKVEDEKVCKYDEQEKVINECEVQQRIDQVCNDVFDVVVCVGWLQQQFVVICEQFRQYNVIVGVGLLVVDIGVLFVDVFEKFFE